MTKRSRRSWVLWAPVGLLVLAVIVVARGGLLDGEETVAVTGQAVARGPLRITVLERGNLQAADSVVLKNQIEGRTTILYLIPEGTWVEEGTLVCELDASLLHEQRVTQEISVQNREATWVKAKQNYAIQKSVNDSEIGLAERQKRFAEMDRTKYLEGDYPQSLQRNDEEILLAQEELQRAEQEFEWSQRLAEKGFLEATQLEADRLSRNRYEIQLNQQRRALDLLKEYEHPRTLEELDADVEEAGRELERVRLRAEARIVDFDAEVRTSKAQLDLEREKLAKIDSQIVKAKIHAPRAGMVVYWQESSGWSSSDPLKEGSEVRERQDLITIPSAGNMIAQASLHESVLEKVKIGMPCTVNVDAVPERTFRGSVRFKAVLPDQVSRWMNPDLRVYRTEIALIDNDERLRPGMSCSVEIAVATIPDTLFVPLQAVFLDAGSPVCFVDQTPRFEMRPIEVGQNDGKWVEVRSGLAEGEIVLLSEPQGSMLRRESSEGEDVPGELELDSEGPDFVGREGEMPGAGGDRVPSLPEGAPPRLRDGTERGGSPAFERGGGGDRKPRADGAGGAGGSSK